MVDSADPDRMGISKQELYVLLPASLLGPLASLAFDAGTRSLEHSLALTTPSVLSLVRSRCRMAMLEEEELKDAALVVFANKQVRRPHASHCHSWPLAATHGLSVQRCCLSLHAQPSSPAHI